MICAVYEQEVIKIDYTGLKCGLCGEDFKTDDDVVVCPECGTPVHRECWKKEGECPNYEKHSKNYVFDGFELIKKSAQGVSKEEKKDTVTKDTVTEEKKEKIKLKPTDNGNKVCTVCGLENNPRANFCNRCGSRLIKEEKEDSFDFADYGEFKLPPGMPDPLGGIPAQVKFEEDVTVADMACYIGVKTPYYIKAFDAVKRKINKFNFSAAIFSGVWFLYRKQYKVGALVFSLETLLYVLRYYISVTYSVKVINGVLEKLGLSLDNISSFTMEQYMNMSIEMQKLPMEQQIIAMLPSILLFAQIVGMILLGVFANKLYYKHCVSKIKNLKIEAAEENLNKAETAQLLNYSGGVNALVAGLLIIIYLFMLLN